MLVTHLGTTSQRSHHRLLDAGDGAVLMEADTRHVWVDRQTGVKTAIPDGGAPGLSPGTRQRRDHAFLSSPLTFGVFLGQIPMA